MSSGNRFQSFFLHGGGNTNHDRAIQNPMSNTYSNPQFVSPTRTSASSSSSSSSNQNQNEQQAIDSLSSYSPLGDSQSQRSSSSNRSRRRQRRTSTTTNPRISHMSINQRLATTSSNHESPLEDPQDDDYDSLLDTPNPTMTPDHHHTTQESSSPFVMTPIGFNPIDDDPIPNDGGSVAFSVEAVAEPVTLDELLEDVEDNQEYQNCFGSRQKNFENIKEFYDTHIRQEIPNTPEWTVKSIRTHFTKHTHFPTDELQLQIAINRNLRTRLVNHVITKDGSAHFENMKMTLSLNREIQSLLKMKKDIPTMYGYSAVLDF